MKSREKKNRKYNSVFKYFQQKNSVHQREKNMKVFCFIGKTHKLSLVEMEFILLLTNYFLFLYIL